MQYLFSFLFFLWGKLCLVIFSFSIEFIEFVCFYIYLYRYIYIYVYIDKVFVESWQIQKSEEKKDQVLKYWILIHKSL